MNPESVKYVECPRDAWQGFADFVPTERKIAFVLELISAGFEAIDLTSFVSPRWVPQFVDAVEVLEALPDGPEYIGIVANERGIARALAAAKLTALGYPFSISETFQQKNTNRGIEESWPLVEQLVRDCESAGKGVVIYLSMGFGNPYQDPWSPGLVVWTLERLFGLGVRRVALADTYGAATAEVIGDTLGTAKALSPAGLELGAHLHSRREGIQAKLDAVLNSGVRWLEGTLFGVGGCPFAGDELVGNLPSEQVLPLLHAWGYATGVDQQRLSVLAKEAASLAKQYAGKS